MKILYLAFINFEEKNSIGVKKKILGQVKGLKNLNNEVIYTHIFENKLIDSEGVKIEEYKFKYSKTYKKYGKNTINYIINNKIEVIYIRYTIIDFFFINFLKKMKFLNIKIYLEIPTFPYDKEISSFKLVIDIIFRKLIRYGDLEGIIISSDNINGKLFNTYTYFVDNCIDIENIKFNEKSFEEENINIIAISFMRKSNGYDRFIDGINYYYENGGKRELKLDLFGEGPELDNLKKKVKEYDLEERIEFHGLKTGKYLDEAFEVANLALGSLADHRVGIIKKSPLKSREYCARGIPFISAIKDCGFEGEEGFILNVDPDDTYIDIKKVVKYYDNLKGKNISIKMRNYAIERFNWEKSYSKINKINNKI